MSRRPTDTATTDTATTDTATSATERLPMSSRAKPLRNDSRSTFIVSMRYSSVSTAMRVACRCWRPKILRVASPPTTSRNLLDRCASTTHSRRCTACLARPMRIMKTGISGSATITRMPLTTSCRKIAAITSGVAIAVRMSWGRKREK